MAKLFAGRPATLLMRAGHEPTRGIWSPDSRRLGFSQDVGGTAPTIVILPQGGGSADPVTSPSFEGDLEEWSPDGQWIVAEQAIHNEPRRAELRILLLPL